MNRTKGAIFEAAVTVFSESGYKGATMDEIALRAGVAKGTLYYHFKSKEQIFNFVVIQGMKSMQEQIENINKSDVSSLNKIKQICKSQVTLTYENREFFKVLLSQLWGNEERQKEVRDLLSQYFKEIEDVLKKAMEDGVVRKGNSELMAFTFFGSIISTSVYGMMVNNSDINTSIDTVMSYMLNGILLQERL